VYEPPPALLSLIARKIEGNLQQIEETTKVLEGRGLERVLSADSGWDLRTGSNESIASSRSFNSNSLYDSYTERDLAVSLSEYNKQQQAGAEMRTMAAALAAAGGGGGGGVLGGVSRLGSTSR